VVLRLEVPAGAIGPCQVCVYVEGPDDCAAGAASVEIVGPGPNASSAARQSSIASPPIATGASTAQEKGHDKRGL
jgi:hypothetical protein